MSFIVSARKYRPQTFDEVVGQQAVTNVLKKAIEQKKLAQALLFTGPRGVGKTSCARIMAREVNKEFLDNPAQDLSFNIFELDAASNNSVDDIRELIEQVRIPPQIAKYKVYIIDEVHMLSNQAFNAFLKTLEEPPEHAIFILATTEKHKIPATILSRCQIFDFKRISVTDIKNHLKKIAANENIQADDDALYLIARKADGALRDALSAFDKIVSLGGEKITRRLVAEHLGILDFDVYFHITEKIYQGETAELISYFNELVSKGIDIHHFIGGLTSHFRDLLLAHEPATLSILEQSDEIKSQYKEQAQWFEPADLTRVIDLFVQTDLNYKISQNPQLLTELSLLKALNFLSGAKKKNLTATEREIKLPSVSEITTRKDFTTTGTQNTAGKSVPENNGPQTEIQNGGQISSSPSKKDSPQKTLGLSALKTFERSAGKEKRREPINKEKLQFFWKEYVEILQKNGEKRNAALLHSLHPEIEQEKIIVTFDNPLSVKEFNTHSGMLLEFLRKKLENDFIEFEIRQIKRLQTDDPSIKYYTKEERLKRLIELNPHVKDLIKKLQLE